MLSFRAHRFSHLLGVCAVFVLVGGSLTGCAAWFQGESSQEAQINNEDSEVVEASISVMALGDLTGFINSDQAAEMLRTEPLQHRVGILVKRHQEDFNASREVLLTVTQIMQGYILSEGHSKTGDKRSLVLIDSDRDALMVVLVDVPTKTYKILERSSQQLDPQAATEMNEYADNWALGQLGMAE